MATFPTGVKSFTTKQDGVDYPQATHINEPQAEITAIEDDLLNGMNHDLKFADATYDIGKSGATRPRDLFLSRNATVGGALSAGASTLATLSVTGASTLAGAVSFGSLATAPSQPRAMVYSTAAQALPSNAFTAVTFEQEQFDVGGLHSTASNPSRLTIPAGSSGLYQCGATIRFSTGGAGNQVSARLIKNSTTEVTAGIAAILSSLAGITVQLSAPMVLDGADYIEVEVFPLNSTSSIPAAAVRRSASELWAMKVW